MQKRHYGSFSQWRKSFSIDDFPRVPFVFVLLLFLIIIFTTGNLKAADFYTKKNLGTWASNATWAVSCAGAVAAAFPGAGDNVFVCPPAPGMKNALVPAATTITIQNLTINAGASVIISAGGTLIVKGTFSNSGTIQGPGTLEINNGILGNVLGTLTGVNINLIVGDGTNGTSVTAGATNLDSLTINASASASFTGAVSINGNFTNNGTYSCTMSTNFYGGSSQAISGNTVTTFDTLNISKSYSTDLVTLYQAENVSGQLILVTGLVIDTGGHTITMQSGSSVASVSDSSFIYGAVTKIGNTAFTFPVGKDTEYRPIAISAPSVSDAYTAEYFHLNPDLVQPPTYYSTQIQAGLDHVSAAEYWTLNNTGTSSAVVTLSWDTYSLGVASLPNLQVVKWDTLLWANDGNGGTTGTTALGTVSSATALTSFGTFTLGSLTAGNSLPIELLTFNAAYNGEIVNVDWITASEINNDYFTVEKAIPPNLINGETPPELQFISIGTVQGAGNSTASKNYSFIDQTPFPTGRVGNGLLYYRLKQTDYNGVYTYSSVALVNVNASVGGGINLFPNPASSQLFLNIAMQGLINATLSIFDLQGRQVIQSMPVTFNNSDLLPFDISALSSGIYTMQVIADDKIWNTKFVKR